MNALRNRFALGFACVAVPMLFVAGPAAADPALCTFVRAPSLDARLAAKADQGGTAVRRYITSTQTIYGLDMATALARAERFRQARDDCAAPRNWD